jgi:hypothetical protein
MEHNLNQILGRLPMRAPYVPSVRWPIVLSNGYQLSVQASMNCCCTPRANVGPYTHVECWGMRGTAPGGFDDVIGGDEPAAYVPVERVEAFIEACGGVDWTQTLHQG